METRSIAIGLAMAASTLLAANVSDARTDASIPFQRVNDDRCTTLVANAFYTGRYLGMDNTLPSEIQSLDLHCGDEFRKSAPSYSGGFVTIFGGSAIDSTDPLYTSTMEFSRKWTNMIHRYANKFPILTGAGPGIMEAGNRGAIDAGGPSIGYTTYYGPARTTRNPALAFQTYRGKQIVTDGLVLSSIEMREILMINHTAAAIIAPGGTGTQWETFEILDGLKMAQIRSIPIYLVGNKQKNWSAFQAFLADMVRRKTVSDTVFKLFSYVENPVDVADSLNIRLLKSCPDCLPTSPSK